MDKKRGGLFGRDPGFQKGKGQEPSRETSTFEWRAIRSAGMGAKTRLGYDPRHPQIAWNLEVREQETRDRPDWKRTRYRRGWA